MSGLPGPTVDSEAVVVISNESLDIFEGLEALEDTILKQGMELVLNRCQHRVLLINIKAKLLERIVPVKLVQVKKLEFMDDLAHASLHFRLVKEGLILQNVIAGQFSGRRFKPRVATFKSVNKQSPLAFMSITYLLGKLRMAEVGLICMQLCCILTRLRPENIIFLILLYK